jgi:hypothetical protein
LKWASVYKKARDERDYGSHSLFSARMDQSGREDWHRAKGSGVIFGGDLDKLKKVNKWKIKWCLYWHDDKVAHIGAYRQNLLAHLIIVIQILISMRILLKPAKNA